MYGRIDLIFSGVNHDCTMPLATIPRQHCPYLFYSPTGYYRTHLCLI